MHVPIQFSQHPFIEETFYSIVCSCPLCQILINHRDLDLFLDSLFCSIGLCVYSYASSRLFSFYLFTFREKRREGEREGEKHRSVASFTPQLGTWPTTQACALTGNQTCDLLVHSTTPNPLSHTSQGCTHL